MVARGLRCEIWGGELQYAAAGKSAKCLACGNEFWFREEKSEALALALDKAAALRRRNDFDGAIDEYRIVISKEPEDAEAHWGLVVSTYGIEYVEDIRTGKLVPTCRRAVPKKSVLDNEDYKLALEYAAPEQRVKYEEQAREIDRLQKEIERKMDAEEDFDVFISFKSTDGEKPTYDRYIARRIYDELEKRGIRTFYSEETLKEYTFDDYEPIIYKALFSCRFFILVATKTAYIESAWVKNEWSRFRDRVIEENLTNNCCAVFENIKTSDLPSFIRKQGVDLSKYPAGGYEIELADNISVRLGKTKRQSEADEIKRQMEEQRKAFEESQKAMREQLAAIKTGGGSAAGSVGNLLKRARQEHAAADYPEAAKYYNKALDADPENGEAWLGLFYAKNRMRDGAPLAVSSIMGRNEIERRASIYKSKEFLNALKYLSPEKSQQLKKDSETVINAFNTVRYKKFIADMARGITLCDGDKTAKDRGKILDDAAQIYAEADKFAAAGVADVDDAGVIAQFNDKMSELQRKLSVEREDFKHAVAESKWDAFIVSASEDTAHPAKNADEHIARFRSYKQKGKIAALGRIVKFKQLAQEAYDGGSEELRGEIEKFFSAMGKLAEECKNGKEAEAKQIQASISTDNAAKTAAANVMEENKNNAKRKYLAIPAPKKPSAIIIPRIPVDGTVCKLLIIIALIVGAVLVHFVFERIPFLNDLYYHKGLGLSWIAGEEVTIEDTVDMVIARILLTLWGAVLGAALMGAFLLVLATIGGALFSITATTVITVAWLVLCVLILLVNVIPSPVNLAIAIDNGKRKARRNAYEKAEQESVRLGEELQSLEKKRLACSMSLMAYNDYVINMSGFPAKAA